MDFKITIALTSFSNLLIDWKEGWSIPSWNCCTHDHECGQIQ